MKLLTHSMMQSFLSCRKGYEYRYLRGLTPIEDFKHNYIGSLVHAGLENWFKYHVKGAALSMIECQGAEFNLDENDIAKCVVLVDKYIELYKEDPFDVVDVEKTFVIPLRNPGSRYTSHVWKLAGKVDGVVRMNGKLYILEHKTTSAIDDAYIGRIAIDSQIAMYATAVSELYGEPVAGAIYDIILKPRAVRHKGETLEEFELRRDALLAKSKTGKSSAKQHIPETLDEYKARLADEINDSFFRREVIEFDTKSLFDHCKEVWSVAKDMKFPALYKNTGNCAKWGKPCAYLPICRSCEDESVIEGLYRHTPIHSELDLEGVSCE